jgi:hypothetical protein
LAIGKEVVREGEGRQRRGYQREDLRQRREKHERAEEVVKATEILLVSFPCQIIFAYKYQYVLAIQIRP